MTIVRTPAEVFPPGEFIREELEERGWTQADLAQIMGRPLPAINQIIVGKRGITPETALELSGAFGTSAEFWLSLETAYRLSKASVEAEAIRKRARLYEISPIKEMERRGWIGKTSTVASLASELKGFYGRDLDNIFDLRVAARARLPGGSRLAPEQLAWCVRALHLAQGIMASKYSPETLKNGLPALRELAAHPEEIRKVPSVLSNMGVRFVVVEHLPKSKIDGAALWLGETGWDKPVVAMSLRYDRIDCFWHTLCHELSHILHCDSYVVDTDLSCERIENEEISEIETRANEEAAEMLIPKETLASFITRVRPYYSKERIIQFANLVRIHPGIVTGQLQHKKQIQWTANREMLVKIREIVTQSALTDGWGSVPLQRKVK